ncbi:hypothetical protein T09_653 [Trichinella sp. T9]|nr:hypothetical protein T09_653 [Trichinella sp. T9]
MPKAFYCTIFVLRAPQAFPPGYAPGQIKICICPQAMPKAFYCTIFAQRAVLCKFWELRLRQNSENLNLRYALGKIYLYY